MQETSQLEAYKNILFLCPVVFDNEPEGSDGSPLPLAQEDPELHFVGRAAKMLEAGTDTSVLQTVPGQYSPAKEARKEIMHLRVIESPDRRSFVPLFTDFQMMIRIFGTKIHVGVTDFETAAKLCLEDSKISGVVIAPGTENKILDRETLKAYFPLTEHQSATDTGTASGLDSAEAEKASDWPEGCKLQTIGTREDYCGSNRLHLLSLGKWTFGEWANHTPREYEFHIYFSNGVWHFIWTNGSGAMEEKLSQLFLYYTGRKYWDEILASAFRSCGYPADVQTVLGRVWEIMQKADKGTWNNEDWSKEQYNGHFIKELDLGSACRCDAQGKACGSYDRELGFMDGKYGMTYCYSWLTSWQGAWNRGEMAGRYEEIPAEIIAKKDFGQFAEWLCKQYGYKDCGYSGADIENDSKLRAWFSGTLCM